MKVNSKFLVGSRALMKTRARSLVTPNNRRLSDTTRMFCEPQSEKSKREHVVLLGTGWAGFKMVQDTTSKFKKLTVISPSNHFLFTPLLSQTAVGTLEFRCAEEPIRTVLDRRDEFIQAKAYHVCTKDKLVRCRSIHGEREFEMSYDKLVIAVGMKTNNFGIESVKEGNGIFFLKQLKHARDVRNNIIDSFEKAAIPGVCYAERDRLLSFVVVGGGPTSCEFVSELHDFVKNDVTRLYGDLYPHVKVSIVEASDSLLGPFELGLRTYVMDLFKTRKINVRLGVSVQAVEDYQGNEFIFPARRAILSDGSTLEFGTLVWSAGLAPVKLVESLDLEKHKGRILVDEFQRVKGHEGTIWAAGDGAVNKDMPLPQLAQVARQQGSYISRILTGKQDQTEKAFEFFSLGSMTSLGGSKGVFDGTTSNIPGVKDGYLNLQGLSAFLMWRSAYWGYQTSNVNKLLIAMHWFKSYVFGRDISRF